ncbi:DUF3180 domain-containing protein [Nesterenkonia sp.]|uniref:DUF3180 domain-containing protein n=1 Tax=Nesterenkonia sp. TaxID=704201 RepID=UPI0026031323|nr:DUF3180 domain-containing protein [Nesterenkonia sp.]
MSQLRPVWLLIILLCAAAGGYAATGVMASAGYSSPGLPLSSVITLAAVGLIVLTLGLVVWWDQRRLQQAADRARREQSPAVRPARRLHPLQAVRVVAAGQACAYAGALLAGWHGGLVLSIAPAAGVTTPNVISALSVMIGATVWVIIGFVVESLCRLPPDQGAEPPEDGAEGLDEEPGAGYARHAQFSSRS